MKNLTDYKVEKLRVMVNTKIAVPGHVVGLHTDDLVEVWATIFRHPHYGSCYERDFALLHEVALHENAVLWPLDHTASMVDSSSWFVIEGDRLARCTKG